jgi:TolA-binding protein
VTRASGPAIEHNEAAENVSATKLREAMFPKKKCGSPLLDTGNTDFLKARRRPVQIDESIARYLSQLDSADRQGEAVLEAKITRLSEKIVARRQEMQRLNQLNSQIMQTEDKQISLTDPDERADRCGDCTSSCLW